MPPPTQHVTASFSQAPGTAERSGMRTARIRVKTLVRAESRNYYLLLGITLFMVGFGLMMVLSSSSVSSELDFGNSFDKFFKQGGYALIGIPLMLLASRLPAQFWQRMAPLILATGCILQILVIATPLGVTVNGNRNWLGIGALPAVQPSEIIKVGVALWAGMFLAKKHHEIRQFRYALLPTLFITGTAILLVTLGGDLGTTMILTGMVIGALFFAHIPVGQLVATTTGAATITVLVALSRPNRVTRILAFLQPASADPTGAGWQIQNGYYALAAGGIFGVGLGNSKQKWSWLPAADTDFIFAIIGDELGLLGCLTVLALILALTLCFLRMIRSNRNPFARVAIAAIMVWIIGQSLINIAVVLGLFPVLGVPLPLISAGGTALISTLLAIGITLSLSRETKP